MPEGLSEWQRDFVRRWYSEAQQEEALRLVERTAYNEESFLRDQKIIDQLINLRPSEEEFQKSVHEIIAVAEDYDINVNSTKVFKNRFSEPRIIQRSDDEKEI